MSSEVSQKKHQKKIVYLNKFDFPDEQSKKIYLPKKISQLLTLATDALDLPRDAQQIFDQNGNPITDIEQIENKSRLLISCTKPLPDPSQEPKYKSRTALGKSIRPVVIPKQPEARQPREDAELQQFLAKSNTSVKENVRNTLVTMYNNLSQSHKAHLECAEALKQLNEESAKFTFDHTSKMQLIGPSTYINDTDIAKSTFEWATNQIKGKKIDDINFAITGPRRSGKTVLLSMFSSIIIEKLIISGEIQNYLPIIINWSRYQPYSGDSHKLFEILCDATFTALKAAKPEFSPILDQIKLWLTKSQSDTVLPAFPPILQAYENLPSAHITVVGQRIAQLYNKTKIDPSKNDSIKNDMESYIQEIVNMPMNLAQVFGFKRVLYVYDHFDTTAFAFAQIVDGKVKPKNSVVLSDVLCNSIRGNPFIVASQDDTEFFKVFVPNSTVITSERIIRDKGEPAICIDKPNITISYEDCRGCPGFCALFKQVCDDIQSYEDNRVIKLELSKIVSSADLIRKNVIKQGLSKLIEVLTDDTVVDEKFNVEDLDELATIENINVSLK